MSVKINRLKRLAFGAAALAVTTATVLPSFMGHASAAGLVTSRYVKMSSDSITGTSVSYEVGFTTATTGAIQGIVVDFCANSPIIGDTTCTAPTGFSVGTPTIAVSASLTAAGSWTAGQLNSNRTAYVTDATNTSITTGTAGTLTISTVTNPTSAAATFYARIYTYATAAGATGYTIANPSAGAAVVDNGGAALATAAQVTVTAKVQETLVFCVYLSACGDAPAVPLGDANGVLASTTTNYTNTSKFDLGSNAASGVVVRLKGDILKTGAFSITSSGATCTADVTTATVEQFGLRVSTAGTGVTATVPYNCSAASHAIDVATACSTGEENVTCTYGDLFASTSTGNVATTPTTVEYMAKAATTTEAGIYTANLGFIATGKY